MSVTVGILSSWRPFALEAAGDALESARGRLDATVGELETAVRVAENAWEGDAALAALERLREHTRTGQPLVETLTVLRRAVHGAADAFIAARGLLECAQGLADAHHLIISNDGTVRPNPLYLDPAVPSNPWAAREHLAWEAMGGSSLTEPRFDTGPGREMVTALAAVQQMVTQALQAASEADAEASTAIRLARLYAADGRTGDWDDLAMLTSIGNRPAPAVGDDPNLVAAWWATLSDAARQQWITDHPDLIGMLDGLPAAARDTANRIRLDAELEDARAEIATLLRGHTIPTRNIEVQQEYNELRDRLAMLESVESGISDPSRSLLLFDPKMPGRAAIGIGDIDTADHVAVLVPGFGSEVTNCVASLTGDADTLVDEAERRLAREGDPSSVGAIAWIGYEAPTTADVAFDSDARAGAEYLRDTLAGLNASHAASGHDVHLTTVGHSYGSVVSGLASQLGTTMDDLVVIGSPGVGVDSAAALDVGPLHVYAGAAADDVVSYLNHFGWDPTSGIFGGQVFEVDGGTAAGADLAPSSGHSEYYGRGTESLSNIASIVVGHPEDVSLGVPRGQR